ncbi:DUF1501 domain-containing protein [Thalassoglobus sp. JC818]|uniref:DUF1501 domain-containing protein n=1 Tax=Thalassoglobus sp. JC818 TaxID=3232136 RepID=UPI00345AD725
MVTPLQAMSSRRQILQSATCGIGYLALMGLCKDALAVDEVKPPLHPKIPHHPARAKQLIFLHMRGGPSAMETFERKPELDAQAGKAAKSKSRKLTPSHWKWRQRGESGLWVSDLFHHQAQHADDLCVLSGMHTDISNHTPAMLQLHTGSFAFTRPSMGAWILYGLGTENQDLPGFVSLCPPLINGGAKNYGSAFLPAIYQGTAIGDIKTPIQDAEIGNIKNGRLSHQQQRRQLDLIQAMNRSTSTAHPADSQIDGVIESFELAFRMQAEVPTVFDISGETQSMLDRYGIGEKKPSDNFGRQCLLARRMIESGVRVVEVCDEFWDQHNNLVKGHEARAAATDQPIGALLADLKERGMLDDTLVVWGGEFGRTPDTAQKTLDGRDHNAKGYTMWLAGGGVRGGFQHGKTDELGYEAVEGRVHLHDLHATILHLLGLDHKELTYRYAGRDFRLTDVHGVVVDEVLS